MEDTPAELMVVLLEAKFVAAARRMDRTARPIRCKHRCYWVPAVFANEESAVTARAVTPLHALTLHSSHFTEMLHRMPELAQRLVGC